MRLFSQLQKWWETRQETQAAAKAAEQKAKQAQADAQKRERDRAGRNQRLADMGPADRAVFLAEANWKMLRHQHRLNDTLYKSRQERRQAQRRVDLAGNAVDKAKLDRTILSYKAVA
jgi:hypothetical protein